MTTLEAIREVTGSCREVVNEEGDRCGRPVEYVLWGKFVPAEGLGPRCYDCAVKHTSHQFVADASAALIDLRRLTWAIEEAQARKSE